MRCLKSHNPARREALRALLSAAAFLAPGLAVPGDGSVHRRRIPGTGEEIPVVGLGSWQTFDVGTSESERTPLREVMAAFVRLGGRLVDSSPMYGESESVLGELATDVGARGKLFLATKVWTQGRDSGIRQMNESFRRLRTDRMDLMQIHNLQDWRVHIKTLREWKEKNRIRYIGITHYTESAYPEIEKILAAEPIDFLQINYSMGERAAESRLLALAHDKRVGVLANRPFAKGGLFARVRGKPLPPFCVEMGCTSWAQVFLKFVISHPSITCAIPATSKATHLIENMQAGAGRLPNAAQREAMARIVSQWL